MADVKTTAAEPIFFPTPAAFRNWLNKNHASSREQWIGFHKKASGRPSITWPESVDEALCVGWIDGLRKTIDTESYKIRFTPRMKESNWSAVNIGRVKELTKQGRMQPAGLEAVAQRKEAKSGIYAYENRKTTVLDKADEKQFRSNGKAWEFFPTPTCLISTKRDLVRRDGEERGNAAEAAGEAHCAVRSGAEDRGLKR